MLVAPQPAADEFFYLENSENTPENHHNLASGVHLMRSRQIDRIIALDDFDVEKAAYLRETFRIPGMGQTTSRYFRDKLAMRVQARDAGINVPPFSPLFHDESITHYLQTVPDTLVDKTALRSLCYETSKVHSLDHRWEVIHSLGDNRHNFLIEQFRPGNVFHMWTRSQKMASSCFNVSANM